ncbi:MAG: hypothetical protein ACE361_07870 [Aureliella sp.]
MEAISYLAECLGNFLAPALAVWAVAALYTQGAGQRCRLTELCFFGAMLIVACCTLRTIAVSDCCWLGDTVSLGCMIVAGTLRKPVANDVSVSI